MEFFTDNLNETQRRCVHNVDGPVLIVAGAGSGKTRVITYRVAYLLGMGVDPFKILVLTFTNKAAKEMRDRIVDLVGDEAKNIWMGTFHSIFCRILRIEAEQLGYNKNFSIYDADESKSLLKAIIKKEMGLDEKQYSVNAIASRISLAKNSLITPQEYQNNEKEKYKDTMKGRPYTGEIYYRYAERCFKANAMDFDDLLLNTCLLFHQKPELLFKYQSKFEYLMVDEFQDTNCIQYVIVKALSSVHRNICVVGDDAQSIYSFRGANIENILNFQQEYSDARVFKLETNYRSSNVIVGASNKLIANNKNQIPKTVVAHQQAGNKIKVHKCHSDNEEGYIIARSIMSKHSLGQEFNKFSILYRTNAQSRAFEESLRKFNIPYKIFGGLSFYQRREVKDLLAYLKLCVNRNDEESLKRIINVPVRGIGSTTIDKITLAANENKKTPWEIIENVNVFLPNLKAAAKIENFVVMMKNFQTMAETKNAYAVASELAEHAGLMKKMDEDDTIEGIARRENLKELLNSIQEFSDTEKDTFNIGMGSEDRSLTSFLQQISLFANGDQQDEKTDFVSLMTVHNAKGLEFENVYLTGLEEGLFPYVHALKTREELEEERRLFYVAITRAKEDLTLSYCVGRFRAGSRFSSDPSRFIKEIGSEYLDEQSVKNSFSSPGFDSFEKSNLVKIAKNNFQNKTQAYKHQPSESFKPAQMDLIAVNQKVEHEIFGFGMVKHVEGVAPNIKATVQFDKLGEKVLLLKFAKLSVVN